MAVRASICLYRKLILTLFIGVSFLSDVRSQDRPKIDINLDKNSLFYGLIVVDGIDPLTIEKIKEKEFSYREWSSFFAIQVGEVPDQSLPLVTGEFSVRGQKLAFKPKYFFVEGLSYNARLNLPLMYSMINEAPPGPKFQNIIQAVFKIPVLKIYQPTQVHGVYPTTDELPMNQLKLYIMFTAPMKYRESYQHIHLIESSGDTVEAPFLQIEQELWDEDHKRFTLWFDPGRIKRDLAPNLQMGLPLQEGKSYTLVISKLWPDKNGNPLEQDFIKEFKVLPPDRNRPEPQKWDLKLPTWKTREPLVINFPEPMDYALIQRMIWVEDQQGYPVKGDISIGGKELSWVFAPANSWQDQRYKIKINTDLEDLAGNNIKRLFDVDLTVDKIGSEPIMEIPFILTGN